MLIPEYCENDETGVVNFGLLFCFFFIFILIVMFRLGRSDRLLPFLWRWRWWRWAVSFTLEFRGPVLPTRLLLLLWPVREGSDGEADSDEGGGSSSTLLSGEGDGEVDDDVTDTGGGGWRGKVQWARGAVLLMLLAVRACGVCRSAIALDTEGGHGLAAVRVSVRVSVRVCGPRGWGAPTLPLAMPCVWRCERAGVDDDDVRSNLSLMVGDSNGRTYPSYT